MRWSLAISTVSIMVGFHSISAATEIQFVYPGLPGSPWEGLAEEMRDQLAPYDVQLAPYNTYDLGNPEEIFMLVLDGRISLAAIEAHVLATEIPDFGLFSLPFLLRSIEEARAVMSNPDISQRLNQLAQGRNLQVLGYSWRVATFASNGGCIARPEDIDGARIYGGSPAYRELFWDGGASPVMLPSSDVYSALQYGMTDTAIFYLDSPILQDWAEVTDCLTDPTTIAAHIEPIVYVAGMEMWAGLTTEQQNALTEAIRQLEIRSDQLMAENAETLVQIYHEEEHDVESITMDDLNEWRDLARPILYSYTEQFGIDANILETIDAIRTTLPN